MLYLPFERNPKNLKMTRTFKFAWMVFFGCSFAFEKSPASNSPFEWRELPQLPPASGEATQAGLAGPFAGVHQDALIVAGGANFPNLPPWKGGKKVWWDDVYVLQRNDEGEIESSWRTSPRLELPKRTAYGVAISTNKGLLCIGGCDEQNHHKDVFRLQWSSDTKDITIQRLPDLPRPLAYMAGAKVGDVVYVAGGKESPEGNATKNFWSLDLSEEEKKNGELQWQELDPWPGPRRILPLAAAQSDGENNCFFLFSGRNPRADQPTQFLTDSFKFNPINKGWTKLADVSEMKGEPICIMAGTALGVGVAHVLTFGGADGKRFLEIEKLNERIRNIENQPVDRNESNSTQLDMLKEEHLSFHENHTGFSKEILAYHVVTDTWTKAGEGPRAFPVTTQAVRWGNEIVIPSGESSPGVRTRDVILSKPMPREGFGALDYFFVGLYLLILVIIGIRLSRKGKTPEDFFKAGGRIPWWAAGLSIFGTQLSAITFMALPAKAYATDWTYLFGNLPILLVAPLVIFCFLPFYRKLNVTTAYEYLEKRFDANVRIVASSFFILLQLARIGIVLLLPSLALSIVTGVDATTCILVMGALCIIYVTLGGIEAVIWTDVLQVFVLVGGAVYVVAAIAGETTGGFQGMLDQAKGAEKLNFLELGWDLSEPTLWTLLLGGAAASFISYGTDQTVVQRYLTTKDEKASAAGIWTNAALTVPATLLFFLVGAALYVFFANKPEALSPHLTTADAILPYYIVTQLPEGLAGLVIAGVFAAAMSSLDSSMNSVAAAVTNDFHARKAPNTNEKDKLRVARIATVVVGLAGTVLAIVLAGTEIKSLWDKFVDFLGLFGGGLGGLFLLAIFAEKAHSRGALLGLIASAVTVFALKSFHPVHPWFYAFAGLASCFLVGLGSSLLLPKAENVSLSGLTWKTRRES